MNQSSYDFAAAAQCMKQGGVALLPTDTNYALACSPWDEQACDKLYAIKQRPPEKPLTLFVRTPEEAREFANLSEEEEILFLNLTRRYWPGPLNVIVPANEHVPRHRYFDQHSVSLVCNHNPQLTALLNAVGSPLALTSANISGTSVDGLVSANDAESLFGSKVDVFIPVGTTSANTTCSSTIVRIVGGRVEVVRQGDIIIGNLQ